MQMVFVGRSSVLIRGITAALGVNWSLAKEWAPIARQALVTDQERRAGIIPDASPSAAGPLNWLSTRLLAPLLAALRRTAAAARALAAAALRRAPLPLRRLLLSLALRLGVV